MAPGGDDKTWVAPFAVAWIEIVKKVTGRKCRRVAPFAGAWIEIIYNKNVRRYEKSLPLRERGLK